MVLPYAPAGDEEIRVEAVRPNGEKTLLLAGRVNVSQFNVTTELEVDRQTEELRPRKHCCSCGSCGTMCEDCFGAYFTCDCVGCTIECGW